MNENNNGLNQEIQCPHCHKFFKLDSIEEDINENDIIVMNSIDSNTMSFEDWQNI